LPLRAEDPEMGGKDGKRLKVEALTPWENWGLFVAENGGEKQASVMQK